MRRRGGLANFVGSFLLMFLFVIVVSSVQGASDAVFRRASAACAAITAGLPESEAREAAARGSGKVASTPTGITLRFERFMSDDVGCFVDFEQGKVSGNYFHEFGEQARRINSAAEIDAGKQ